MGESAREMSTKTLTMRNKGGGLREDYREDCRSKGASSLSHPLEPAYHHEH